MALIRTGKGKSSGKGSGGGWGKGGGGKGKGGGSWVFVPVQSSFRSKGGFKGGKGKGRKGGGKDRKPYSELSEERKEEIRAKHAEKQAEQGREEVDDEFHTGSLVQRGKRYGWIKPAAFGKLPSEVQAKIKEMCKAKKATVRQNNSDNAVFNQNVLFLHMSDVEEGMKIDVGDKVQFKVYIDNEGAGAREVTSA